MIKVNRIRESYSPWASPVTLAKKKSNSYRFCIDYHKLNAITIPDAYLLPRIDELLERFHQVEMEETEKEKTAFIYSEGLYEFNVMPFGLRNAPGTFQRIMDKILREYIGNFVEIYVDDIMIYSKNLEEHIEHIEKVLQKLQEYNLVIKLKKCKFYQKKIKFLGHEIGNDGLKPNFKKIETIDKIKEPRTVTEVRSFLGLCSYYRRFVKGFSKIAKPLIELTKKEVDFKWSDEYQKSFNELKKILVKNPILAHPDFSKEFILITDALADGLGAILSQKNDEDKEVVIAYASKNTNSTERNYPITDLECLAIIWAT
ncbi:retroviral-like aspartic protease 1 [Rhizophagus clarus]|uniref:Retroviral-like aspartic protease 1 n=1 Tax=Rhizophagus clarus TaxID=94130 RepID=A0A8H3R1S1_9GLOM|nr:retroviral-like aspartic protease 1 [Rhizophagus clarus]